MYDVIIVGGGAAGLMAAKLLSEAGKKILLLEARAQIGGRIHAIKDFSFPAEGGAEFIHGNLKTTFDLLEEAGLKKTKIAGKFCRVTNGKWSTEWELIPHWKLLIKKLYECKEDVSLDMFLETFFKEKKYVMLKKQFKNYIEGYDAADTNHANIFAIRNERKNEDEEQYRPVPDYAALIAFLQKSCLKHNGVIKTNEPVKEIRKNATIEVITSATKYSCKNIIIAVPLGVLQCRKNNSNFINFPSNLNAYMKAAKKIGNGGVIKFLLEFDAAFWLDKKFLKAKNITAPSYIFTNEKIPTWWTQYPSKVPLLTGWIAGPSSHKLKKYSQKAFKQLLLSSLSGFLKLPSGQLEKRLIKFKVMNWISEPYILGGYSYSTVQTEAARKFLNQAFEDSFYFAGEYILKNSSSTVDAAMASGKQVAEEILKKY
jgi:monoamine oxidase